MNSRQGFARIDQKEQPDTAVLFSIGHSNRDICPFIILLLTVSVQTVVDCRTKPRSRWRHFNDVQLATHLASMDINYEFRGHNLGGLGTNIDFAETLDELKERAKNGERIALMCSEGDPMKCHRGTILAPELESRGVEVKHLLYPTKNNGRGQLAINW